MRLGVEAVLVDGRLLPGDVAVDDGTITAVGLEPGGSRIAAPGFVDLQVNGFAGVDFLGADADGFAAAGEALLETGVTAYLPTLITSGEERPRPRPPRDPEPEYGAADPRRRCTPPFAPARQLAGETGGEAVRILTAAASRPTTSTR